MNLKPLGNRIVMKKLEKEEKTKGGIILTSDMQKAPEELKVIEVGSDVKNIKKGDMVVCEKFKGTELTISGEIYLIADEENILATLGQ